MKLVFAGTPEFAAVSLEALLAARHEVTLVLPVIQTRHRLEGLLVNQSLKRLTKMLASRRRVTVVAVPHSPGGPGRKGRRAVSS